ncbi:MAG: methyltransferase domain-containing protein [Burkholderiales bacterium]|nr:methyltransferase domain-containing protein [Burkholderiales bacterium]MBK8667467.1 methyltransferase domain-containing protein [Burkholderiales bacterium]
MTRSTDPAPADAVAAALAAQPRRGFLPPELRERAEYDGPLPIGHGQTNSQPRTVANMLRLLEAGWGMRVLDVGAGSGWTTALLAHLVGPGGQVLGVELVPELARWGAENLAATQQPWASIAVATPGVLGLPEQGLFDRILVSAEATELPQALVQQLHDGGVMVIPVAGEMLRVQRRGAETDVSRHGGYRFVPLR